MALGALTLGNDNVGFDADGTAMVPVSAGGSKLGEIKIKSPLDTFKDTFFDMKESLSAMVGIQTKEAKRQAFHDQQSLKQKSFENEQANKKFEDAGMQGPGLPTLNNDLEGVDTDNKKVTNVATFEASALNGILGTLKDSFDRVSFGEKMTAILLVSGLALFTKFKEPLVKVLTPIVQFVKDLVEQFGPGAVFAGFIGIMLAFKTGLAQFILKFAAGGILKGIAFATKGIKDAGGIMFLAGKATKNLAKGVEAMNSGLKTVVTKIGGAGKMITGGLTKGFTMLGRGLTTLRLGIMSMSSSLGAMLVPFLPVIAIAAAAVAVFYSLKSGFDVFKQSLEDGDSMFTAVLKGLGDAMLTLVTLPYVLIQKLVGYIAGLFEFDNFKEKLESFDIKKEIIESFSNLMSGMTKIIKAIAKGAGAALAAVFSVGKTPQEEFARAYREVMSGGEGKASLEGTPDFQGDQSKEEFNREKATFADTTGMEDYRAGNKVGDGSAAESFYANKRAEDKFDEDYLESLPKRMSESSKKFHLKMRKKALNDLDQKMEQTNVIKNADGSTTKTAQVVYVNNTKGGDTINNKNENNISGDLAVDNTEYTQKLVNESF